MMENIFIQHADAWLALAALGVYHGINPAMGWLFAVSNGMQERRASGVFKALPPLAAGHFLSMVAVLLPFAALAAYATHLSAVRIGAGALLIAFGVYKLIDRRHPRWLARVGPRHLVLWSFLMATAHGAGLMLAPVYLDMRADPSHGQMGGMPMPPPTLLSSAGTAIFASFAHAVIMIVTAGLVAWLVYRFFGLRLLSRAWVNLDLIWAAFLIIVGGIAVSGLL